MYSFLDCRKTKWLESWKDKSAPAIWQLKKLLRWCKPFKTALTTLILSPKWTIQTNTRPLSTKIKTINWMRSSKLLSTKLTKTRIQFPIRESLGGIQAKLQFLQTSIMIGLRIRRKQERIITMRLQRKIKNDHLNNNFIIIIKLSINIVW